MSRLPLFVTLGPEGTNHELVTRRYLQFHDIAAEILLIDSFFDGLTMIAEGQADYLLQVAVHPDCAEIVARAHFEHGIHVIDTFISPSKELAILTRSDVGNPQTLAVQPATRGYADVSAWPSLISVSSIARVADGLLNGTYDSGLTTRDLARAYPDRLRVEQTLGTVDDAWLVFGKSRVSKGGLVAWSESPGVKHIKRVS